MGHMGHGSRKMTHFHLWFVAGVRVVEFGSNALLCGYVHSSDAATISRSRRDVLHRVVAAAIAEESSSTLTESTDDYSLWLWSGCSHRPNTPLGPGQVLPSSISLSPLSATGIIIHVHKKLHTSMCLLLFHTPIVKMVRG